MVMIANFGGIEFGYLAGRYPGVLGHLYSPGSQVGPYSFMPYALDNGAYGAWANGTHWNEREWLQLLAWANFKKQRPLWAVVPDVVTNREKTIANWHRYAPVVRAHDFRPAFAIQNGMTFDDVPDDECMLFLGGTTDWKEQAIEPWCKQFPGRVHVGKVNERNRLMKCYEAGAVSVDGTGWWHKKTTRKSGSSQREDLERFCEFMTNRRAA